MKSDSSYQFNYSEIDESLYEPTTRLQKAKKVIAVLQDYLGSLEHLDLLDVSSSTGIMTRHYADPFRSVIGVDIDTKGLRYAVHEQNAANLTYFQMDALKLGFADASFDVVVCSQMYEHVPDPQQLMNEIYRVLKSNGVCFFSATNRLKLVDNHYGRLPFLSILPKPLAHLYLRILGRTRYYYETHLTLWGLKSLVNKFDIIDYTRRIVEQPDHYAATEMLRPDSIGQKFALAVVKHAYWLFPGYIWLLRKSSGN